MGQNTERSLQWTIVIWVLLSPAVWACSGGSGQARDGASEVGGGGGTGGATGATGGRDGGGPGGAGRAADCSGTWGEPQAVFEASSITSPAITGDERELFFAQGAAFLVAVRSTASGAFATPVAIPEIEAPCAGLPGRGIDVSDDGLRLYFWCATTLTEIAPLRYAERPDRSSPFVMGPTLGDVGSSPSVDAAELVAYSSGTDPFSDPPRAYNRTARDVPFGAPAPIPGLEATNFISPDLAADGLALFGASAASRTVLMARRPTVNDLFGPPEALFMGESWDAGALVSQYGSPSISADCRALYFVRLNLGQDAGTTSTLMVARR
jgi:hypothetical protein